jgi:hypothetical protein
MNSIPTCGTNFLPADNTQNNAGISLTETTNYILDSQTICPDNSERSVAVKTNLLENTADDQSIILNKLITIFEKIGVSGNKHKELAEQATPYILEDKSDKFGLYSTFMDNLATSIHPKADIFIGYKMENNMPYISEIYISGDPKVNKDNYIDGIKIEDQTNKHFLYMSFFNK